MRIYMFMDTHPTSPNWREGTFAKVEHKGKCIATFDGLNCWDRAIGFTRGWYAALGKPFKCPDLTFVDLDDTE